MLTCTFEIVLPLEPCRDDVLLPALDANLVLLVRDEENREWTEQSCIVRVHDLPRLGSLRLVSIRRDVEGKAHVQVAHDAIPDERVEKQSRLFVDEETSGVMERLDVRDHQVEVVRMLVGAKRVRKLVPVPAGVEVVLLVGMHDAEHASHRQEFWEPGVRAGVDPDAGASGLSVSP